MGVIDVDVIGLQPAEALLDFDADRAGAQVALDRVPVPREPIASLVVAPPQPALGRDDDLVAPSADRLADQFFAMTEAVDGRGIDDVDPAIECGMNGTD